MRLGTGSSQTGAETQGYQFNLPIGVVITVTALMLGVEAGGEVFRSAVFILIFIITTSVVTSVGCYVEFVALAAIAEIESPFVPERAAPSFGAKLFLRDRFEAAKFLLEFGLGRLL